jgi:hypothetical protein
MMNRLKCIVVAAVTLLPATGPQVGWAQSGILPNDIERVGQSGWQFLKINGDPRQAAMGNAFTALSHGDANAVFGNPASLADVEGNDLQLNSLLWVADITHQSASIAHNFGDWGVVAFSVATVDYGDMPETVNSIIVADGRTEAVVTGNTFTARDVAVGISYARKITDHLSIGGSARWLRQGIAELSMTNWAFDFGTLYYTGYRTLRIGMAARNFGPDSHLIGWSEQYQTDPYDVRMPIDFRVGIAMDVVEADAGPHRVTVALDGDHPNDGPEKVHLGAEYAFDGKFSLRAGYKFNYDEQGLTFGAGVRTTALGVDVVANYAYVGFGALKQVHMFSLGIAL